MGAIYFYTPCIILFFFDEWCFFLCFSPSCPGWRKSRWLFFHDEAGKVIKDKIPKMPSFTNYFWVVDW
jgi:hypothetical protein